MRADVRQLPVNPSRTRFIRPARWLGDIKTVPRASNGLTESLKMKLRIEAEQEEDGRWLAEIPALPGVMVYGQTREEAIVRVKALALRTIADRLEHGEAVPETAEAFTVSG